MPFEVIEHTADVGIVARGDTLAEMFVNAARGMLQFLIAPDVVRPRVQRRRTVEAEDTPGLLVAWLNDLLLLLNADGFVPSGFEVLELTDRHLAATVLGEPVDPSRHHFRLDVKAATYHQLELRKNAIWQARIIFDV